MITLGSDDLTQSAAEQFAADSRPVDKTCVVNIHNVQGWDLDAGILMAVLTRVVAWHAPQASLIDIYPQERERDGSAQWICNLKYRGGGGMTIVALQREAGAVVELHS